MLLYVVVCNVVMLLLLLLLLLLLSLPACCCGQWVGCRFIAKPLAFVPDSLPNNSEFAVSWRVVGDVKRFLRWTT